MPESFFDRVLGIVNQVDKCARVLQQTDDLADTLATPANVIDARPDDEPDADAERKQDDAP